MSAPHEKRICKGLTSKQLDTIVSDYHIFSIASDIKDWKRLAPQLFLTESDQEEIAHDFEDSYYLQKKDALSRWRCNSGHERSTYRALIRIFCLEKQIDVAEKIADYCGSKEPPINTQMLHRLNWYLLECYRCVPHPFCLQLPSRLSPPFPKSSEFECKFFDLILHKAHINERQMQTRSVDSSLHVINLYNALTKGKQEKRLLVYFEGIAGSGKTTLAWHISREWAEKRLLQNHLLLIHIQINDPKVQSARCLQDLIPNPDDNKVLQKEIAEMIVGTKGRNICFLLDGLDEAPTGLLDFLLVELIQGKVDRQRLPGLSFILMSRPDSRVIKRLESVLSSRIVIAGFNKEAMDQFFDSTLGTKSDEKRKLMEKFAINPRLEGLCSLPINAVIMSFLIYFAEGDNTPTTQTDLYKPLISNFLLRHIEKYLPQLDVSCIEDLHKDIPQEVSEPFRKVCSLAYSSLLNNKHLFTTKEVGIATDVKDVLGFLQVCPQIVRFGRKRYYSFAHLSLQEFLAAVHISKMSENDQTTAINEFLSKSPRSQMIPFYAGLTGLSNKEALQVLSEALPQTVDSKTIMTQLLNFEENGDPQQKALALLNSLFESQNESLTKLSITDLPVNSLIQEGIEDLHKDSNFTPQTLQLRSLLLHSLPLTPLDCLSIGYYINIKSCMPAVKSHIISFDFVCCSLNHTGIHILFTELKKNISQRTTIRVQLIMTANKFNSESLLSLKVLLQGQSNVEGIALCNCLEPSIVCICFALRCLIEGLSKNSSCGFIDLSANNFDSSHIHYIVLLLRRCPQIYWLELKDYDLSRVMPLFSRAVALMTNLHTLDLSYCNISDSDLILLGKEICENHSLLHHLSVLFNPFTHRGLSNFLKLFVGTFSRLGFLGLCLQLNEEQVLILKQINLIRSRLRLPNLCTKTIKDTCNFSSSVSSMLQLEQLRKTKDRN